MLALSTELCKSGDMESYRANEARLKMREILTAVERGEHIELKRYDTPTGVIVPSEWYEKAKAALEVGLNIDPSNLVVADPKENGDV